jgi:hypothetical protein
MIFSYFPFNICTKGRIGSKKEVVLKLILWEPSHGKRSRGRPFRNFIDQLADDSSLRKEELVTAIEDIGTYGKKLSRQSDRGRSNR